MKMLGRNDSCSCGSGRKYKNCCYRKPFPQVRVENSMRMELVDKVLAFMGERYPEALEAAYELFWGDFDPQQMFDKAALEASYLNFVEWFVHDFLIGQEGGATPIELYERGGMALDPESIGMLERMRKTVLSLYEIQDVRPEEGLLLNDLFRGGTCEVHERLGTRNMGKWDLLAVRLIFVDDGYVMSGSVYPFARRDKNDLLDMLERLYREYLKEEPEGSRTDFLKLLGYVFNRIWCQRLETPFKSQLVNSDGHQLVLCTARFELDDQTAVRERLRSIECFEEEDGGVFHWLRETGKKDSSTIIGIVRLRGLSLILECNSKERLEAGKALLRERLGAALGHRADTFQDPCRAMDELPPYAGRSKSGIPLEIESQLRDKVMREHYEKWIDEKIPALSGKTPRQAVKTAAGRKRVVELLKQIENAEEHARLAGEAFCEFGWLWEKLGIDRNG